MQTAFLRDRPQHERARNIGRSLIILTAAVHQQHAFRLQFHIAFFICAVMHHRRMILICRNGVEARFDEQLLFLTECQQLIACGDLRDLHFSHIGLQPIHEAGHRHRVTDMTAADIFQLHRILYRLHQHDRIRTADHFHALRQRRDDAVVGVCLIQQHPAACSNMLDILIDRIIVCRTHADLCKCLFQIIAQPIRMDIEHGIIRIDDRIAQCHRETRNVIRAHVEQPGDVINTGDDVGICAFCLHGLADFCQLLPCAFAGILDIQFKRLCGRERRTCRPDLPDKIHITADLRSARLQHAFQLFHHGRVHDAAVKAQNGMLRQSVQQILFDRRHTFIAHAHQIDAAAFQLLGSLDEITAVRPQLPFFCGKDTRSCRTGESAHICPCLEIITNIFCFVKIRCRHDVGIHSVRLHLRAKLFCPSHDLIHFSAPLSLALL